MAGTDRTQAHDLIDWQKLVADLPRAGLFAVVRQAEARSPNKPRLGKARLPEHSVVDLAQQPSLGFAASTLASIDTRYGRPQLRGNWLGLLGPMGPLPIHLSEFAFYEHRMGNKKPFGDWLDLISGRMLQLFYRAWAEAQPTAHADRPGDDRFAKWLGALSGAGEGAGTENSFFHDSRVHYAALYSGSRSAVAIQDALSHLLVQPVRVMEYVPKWREFEPEDRSRLGRGFVTLGTDAVLGSKVFSAADAFRVVVRAQNFRDYQSLMPGGERFAVCAEAIESFKPGHLEWDLCVELDEGQAPPLKLDGRSRLGWTGWIKRPAALRAARAGQTKRGATTHEDTGRIRADAHLRKTSMKKRKPA